MSARAGSAKGRASTRGRRPTLSARMTDLEKRLTRLERRRAPIGFFADLRGSGVGEGLETFPADRLIDDDIPEDHHGR